jgi:hypothetical protein
MLKGRERAVIELIVEVAVTGTIAKFWKLRLKLGDADPKEKVLLIKAV